MEDIFTAENLSRVTERLIAAFRAKDARTLAEVMHLMPGRPASQGAVRDFAFLIKEFHPDRLRALLKRLHSKASNAPAPPPLAEVLAYLQNASISQELPPKMHAARPDDREFEAAEEETGYDETDFDSSFRPGEFEEAPDFENPAEPDAERDFICALKLKEYGTIDVTYTPSVLRAIEGSIDLSDYEMDSLAGVEYCTGLRSLNLSDNLLSDLSPLEGLVALEELYLSGNEIGSVEALAGLVNLRILDLSFNPLQDITAILELPRLEVLNLVGVPTFDKHREALSLRGVVVVD